jgi:hypothetical protein
VSSRARRDGSGCCGIAKHPFVDDVGQVAFERAERFHGRFAFGEAPAVVGPAGSVTAQLDDGHDVQDPVDTPVADSGQSVAALVTG